MKKIILLLSVVLFVVSCGSDKDDEIIKNGTSKGKLAKVIKESERGTTVNTFIYGTNGFVKEIEDENITTGKVYKTFKFHYNSKNYIDKFELHKANGEVKFYANVNYDNEDKMISFSNENGEITVKYNNQGFLIEENEKGIYGGNYAENPYYIDIKTYKYDSDGDLKNKVHNIDRIYYSNTLYIYDNKENPIKGIFPNNFKLVGDCLGDGVILRNILSNNNVFLATSVPKNNKQKPKTRTYTYTYVGNLPETVTYKDYEGKEVKETLFYNN